MRAEAREGYISLPRMEIFPRKIFTYPPFSGRLKAVSLKGHFHERDNKGLAVPIHIDLTVAIEWLEEER